MTMTRSRRELTNVVGGVGQLGRGQLGYHYETDANGIEHT
jgi:hypothetical protein